MARSRSSGRYSKTGASLGGMSLDSDSLIALYDKLVHVLFMGTSLFWLFFHSLWNPIQMCCKGGTCSCSLSAWIVSPLTSLDRYLTSVFKSLSSISPCMEECVAMLFFGYAACELLLVLAGLRGRSNASLLTRLSSIKHVIMNAITCACFVYLYPIQEVKSKAIYGLFYMAMLFHTWLSMDPANFAMIYRYSSYQLKWRYETASFIYH